MERVYKILILAVIISSYSFLTAHAAMITPESKITSVTVYPDSVLVTRSAVIDLVPGEQSVQFDNVIPEIDENSLSVTGSGTADAQIAGAYLKREFLEESADERIKTLLRQIEDLQDQILRETNNTGTLETQKEFLKSVKLFSGEQISKDLVTKNPSPSELEGVLNFLGTSLTTIEKQKDDVRIKVRGLQKDKDALERQLAELRGGYNQKTRRSIVTTLTCQKAGKLTLNVSYLVHGVNWYPLYDARASLDKQEVQFTSYGVIQQSTGEDWENVDLALSTAKPSLGGRLPYVAPWIVRPYQPPVPMAERRKVMALADMAVSAPAEQYQAYNTEALGGLIAEQEEKDATVAVSQAVAQGISVVYKLPNKVTVKSDGTEHKFPIASQSLKADYAYSAYPRLSPFAYLGSRVTNDKDLQMLAGRVNVFLEGDYVGTSSIDNIGPGEEFDLYLGVDENVKIERKEIEKKVDDVLIAGISSPNRKTSYKYRLSAENYKGKAIKLILFEAMPVSENDRIKVKIADVSLPPRDKDWKDRPGIWRWELGLAPKAKQEIFYTFIIEHPRDMQVDGL